MFPPKTELRAVTTTRNYYDNFNGNYCYKGHHFLGTHSDLDTILRALHVLLTYSSHPEDGFESIISSLKAGVFTHAN